MKFIPRTDMTHHAMPVNAWPDWTFSLWALGCGDCIVAEPGFLDDVAGYQVSRWRVLFWRLRGPILRAVFGRLWWWV